MAHQRISEYRAKHLLEHVFGNTYSGLQLDNAFNWRAQVAALPARERFVLKVDQAVKGRFKQGLVALDLTRDQVAAKAAEFFAQGFRYVLVEPHSAHDPGSEHYLSLRRGRAGTTIMYGSQGGANVEQSTDTLHQAVLRPASAAAAARTLGLTAGTLERLRQLFDEQHLALLEMNPLLVDAGRAVPLDAAVVVDDAAAGLGGIAWSDADFRQPPGPVTAEETAVAELDSHTPSSFSLKVLNPHGQIFVLLSGGGASLVVVDEITHLGAGTLLGNYGEYSGDPSTSEVTAYARHILALLLRSRARPKILLIAGGVANFTDIRTTFDGLTAALDEAKAELLRQGVKVYVRRGGPGADEALTRIQEFLAAKRLLGRVSGPEQPLSELVQAALRPLTKVAVS